MLRYIAKRLLELVLTLFIVSIIVFAMVRFIPGDPIAQMYGLSDSGPAADPEFLEHMREKYGLNDPLPVQYFRWVGNIFKGDMGTSIMTRKSVVEELGARFPNTLVLAIGGTLLGGVFGIIFGIIACMHHNKFADGSLMVFSLLAVSTPSFFLAMLLMLLFSLNLGWLPSIGLKSAAHAVLPILTLVLHDIGTIARTTRSAMLDVINQDYIRTSVARGVSRREVVYSHAFKNALIPVVTSLGMRFGSLLAGAALVETVFSIPGLGRFMVDGITNRDYAVVQSTVLVFACTFVLVNTLVDILYAWIDPRIKYD